MGASIIDALVVTLGLDGSLFKRGMADAEKTQKKADTDFKRSGTDREKQERIAAEARKKRQKEVDDQAKRSVEGYKKIRNELLAIAAVFTAGVGIKDFITNTINSAANLGYLSANLRMSTQDLTSWQRASERAGGSAEGIVGQLKESADTLAQLKSGFGPNEGLQNFFRFGGSADELKDGNTYLLARSRIIADLFKRDPAQAALISKQMGISEDQFNFLKQGPQAVMALVRAQEKNAAVTAKDAQAALELRNKVLDLRDSLQATATRIVLQLAPAIERLFARLEAGSLWVAAHKGDIAKWVNTSIIAIKEFVRVADSLAKSVGGWKNVLIGLGAIRMTGAIAGLTGVATAIGGIVAAGAGIPALVAGLGALSAYAGYKGAEMLFGKKKKPADKQGAELRKQNADIMAGGHGSPLPKIPSKADMRAEAARQRDSAPLSTPEPGQVVDTLKTMGWTSEQAAGIAGSFMQESGLDPAARNPQSGAYGIGQWLGSRVADFKKFSGRPLVGSSLDEQLKFFHHEVTDGKEKRAGDQLRATKTAEDAARVHSAAYERPGAEEANIGRRQRLAAALATEDRVRNAMAVGAMPSGSTASVPVTNNNSQSSTAKTEVKIDNITVNTQATDAQGIATAIRPAFEKYTFATQANTGMR